MKFFCVLSLTAGVLVACSSQERDPGQWPISQRELEQKVAPAPPGEATYRRYCIGCHGADGRANGGVTGADFVAHKSELSAKPDAELTAAVRDGKRGERGVMPSHRPVLNDAQIDEVIAYVRTRFFQDASNSP
jgi:mono/diheme cytochrome c family protein